MIGNRDGWDLTKKDDREDAGRGVVARDYREFSVAEPVELKLP